jgi:hypothetical protein
MREDPNVRLVLDPQSWVASWVSTLPQTAQDALLEHEQGHYDIGVLNASDFCGVLQGINGGAFSTAAAGVAAVVDLQTRLGATQPIHNKYDRDTRNGAISAMQARWNAALSAARGPTSTLRGELGSAGLFP